MTEPEHYYCRYCLGLVRATVPRGGDGSALVAYRHCLGTGQTCPGSRLRVLTADQAQAAHAYKQHRDTGPWSRPRRDPQ